MMRKLWRPLCRLLGCKPVYVAWQSDDLWWCGPFCWRCGCRVRDLDKEMVKLVSPPQVDFSSKPDSL